MLSLDPVLKLNISTKECSDEITSAQNYWKTILEDLHKQYGDSDYRDYFDKLKFLNMDKGVVLLSVPSSSILEWINTNYITIITRLWRIYNPSISDVNIIVDTEDSNNYTEQNVFADDLYIDSRYNFDNFVVGKSNELAYAATRSVAQSAEVKRESNPLFIYGGVGLGKTHLMHAIANYIKSNNPKRKVAYLSAEKFMYLFIQALRNKDILSFKKEVRSVDVLMIDDIQFICGKDSTQEELFHTFNELVGNNNQVIMSCDRSPSDLENIEERIRSRLGWGLVVDIHRTTFELRLGILQSKIQNIDRKIPKEVLEFLASKITSNIRELEGALNKVIAYADITNHNITVDFACDILQDLIRANDKQITISCIQKKVAEHFNIKVTDLSQVSRQRSKARPRQVAMYLCKKLTSKSLADIGYEFGRRDHSTVIYAIQQVDKMLTTNKEVQESVQLLTKIISN